MAPSARVQSSQCTITGRFNRLLASSAARMSVLSRVESPSSEKPIAPAAANASKSTASLLCRPFVIAAIGKTRTLPSEEIVFASSCSTSTLSSAGLVFGMQQIAVNPPAAAAAVPVAIDSLYSKPGVRVGPAVRMYCLRRCPAPRPFPQDTEARGGQPLRRKPRLRLRFRRIGL